MDISQYPNIWCDTCNEIRPLVGDEMHHDDRTDHDATDLIGIHEQKAPK